MQQILLVSDMYEKKITMMHKNDEDLGIICLKPSEIEHWIWQIEVGWYPLLKNFTELKCLRRKSHTK